MKTTKEERMKAREGCEFYHHSHCINSVECFCLSHFKQEQKQKQDKESHRQYLERNGPKV